MKKIIALVLIVGGVCWVIHSARIEMAATERSLQKQMSETCPKFWANEELAKKIGIYEEARKVCPET